MQVRVKSLVFIASGYFVTTSAGGQVSPPKEVPHELKGIVIDISRTPIARAEIIAASGRAVLSQTTTASDGTFNLGIVPPGSVSVKIRQLGYEPKTVELQIGTERTAPLDITLTASATELKQVVINVATEVGPLDEFNQHRKQNRGSAKFFDQEEIRRRGAMYPSDLFRTVPGVTVKFGIAGGNAIRIRGCQPVVWIDGQRVPGAELDEVAAPGDIAGIEFYPSMAGTPAKYMERSERPCGTLLVWSRTR